MTVHALADPYEIQTWMTSARSPAREALARFQDEAQAAATEVARLGEPVNRARAMLAEAESALREAEAAIASLDQRELDDLVATARDGKPTRPVLQKERAGLEKRAGDARRHVDQMRATLATVTEPHDAAKATARALQSGFAPLIAAVAAEVHLDAMRKRNGALQEARRAEITARSIVVALSEEGHRLQQLGADADALSVFRAGQPLAQAFVDAPAHEAPSPRDLYAGAARCAAWMTRLADDPDAVIE